MQILAPIDGSDASFRALRLAAQLATSMDADLAVIHITDEETDATATIVERAREVLEAEGVDAEPEVSPDIELEFRPGDRIGEDILDVVTDRGIDHVVMGHHGAGALERAILGSAAETVLEAKRIPVTVVP